MPKTKREKSCVESLLPHEQLGKLWCLRMLVRLDATRKVLRGLELDIELLRELLGVFNLPELLEVCERVDYLDKDKRAQTGESPLDCLRQEVPRAFRRCLKNLVVPRRKQRDLFEHNLDLLTRRLSLNPTERLLVHFALLVTQLGWFRQVAENLGPASYSVLVTRLTAILDTPAAAIRAALSADGTLACSGLLRLSGVLGTRLDLTDRLVPLEGLMEMLSTEHGGTLGLFQYYFRRAGEAELTEKDFADEAEDYALMRECLQAVHGGAEPGVNMLIYGRPGVGKTQMAKLLAKSLGRPLYEVATAGRKDETLDGKERLRAYALSQRVLAREPDALVLFDEAEDVFGRGMPFFPLSPPNVGGCTKAAINRVLEENPVPTLWVTNSIAGMDSAYLRRFQYIVELRGGTRATRRRNFSKHLKGIPVSESCLAALAEQEALVPAVVANAAKLLRTLDIQDRTRADRTVCRVVENTLHAMGKLRRPIIIESPPTPYSLRYANPDTDLDALVAGLRQRPHARLCLYGPPGTGKTAFGRHLAEQLDKPLLVKRASDLLSMWVGMSERNIANMFRDAEREHAVLLLDEADSLLRGRAGAQRSWEVTQVNEMLAQMEVFEGIFIASTNLMDVLDIASLRRFDFKVRFDYLTPKQASELFMSVLGTSPGKTLTPSIEGYLKQLINLTPGDFAVVSRKAKVFGTVLDSEKLIQGLENECRLKETKSGRRIGFTAVLQ